MFVNLSLAVLDGLLHGAVEGERATPPPAPSDGTAWLVASGASGDWADHAGQIALRQSGQWLYVPALDGMQLLDRSRSQIVHRLGGAWRAPPAPTAATGGSVIDVQARQALSALVAALQQWGVFASG